MSVYFVSNQKGGVGKSSISALLIRTLMDRGIPKIIEVETRASSLVGLTGGMEIDVRMLPSEAEITRDSSVLENFYLGIAASIGDAHREGRDVVVDFGAGTSLSFWEKTSTSYLVKKALKNDVVLVVPTTSAVDSLNPAAQVLAATRSIGIERRILVWNEKSPVDRVPSDLASLQLDFDEHIVVPMEQTGLLQRAASAGVPLERIISAIDDDTELQSRAGKLFPDDSPLMGQMKALEQFSRLKTWLETALVRVSQIANREHTAV